MKSFDQQVADWARTKPADEAYDFGDMDNCALCQFLAEAGLAAKPEVGGFTWTDEALVSPTVHSIPRRTQDALPVHPWTFGALADRLSS